MRATRALSVWGILTLACAFTPAQAHVRVGIAIGVPGPWYPYAGYYYYPPPYYYPPVVTVPSAPPVYIERAAPAHAGPDNYWYYCASAKAYYPYVRQCAGGWTRVSPRPPDAH